MKSPVQLLAVGLVALVIGTPAPAEPLFTTVEQVRPILEMTRANWVALRDYEGRDWLYFTHLGTYRCAISEIRYGLNGAPAETLFEVEPCYIDEPTPFVFKESTGVPVWLVQPGGSVQQVAIRLVLTDGSEMEAVFERAAILMP